MYNNSSKEYPSLPIIDDTETHFQSQRKLIKDMLESTSKIRRQKLPFATGFNHGGYQKLMKRTWLLGKGSQIKKNLTQTDLYGLPLVLVKVYPFSDLAGLSLVILGFSATGFGYRVDPKPKYQVRSGFPASFLMMKQQLF